MSGTRRDFLRQVARAGGYRATYLTMQAMGLLGTAALAEPLALETGVSHKTKVVILGAGIAGTNACQVAVGTGAHVSILDIDPGKLRYVHDILAGHVTTVMSNRANIEEEVMAADLVIEIGRAHV